MKGDIRVPDDVNPVERIIEIKDQEIAEIVDHYERRKSPYTKWTQQNNDEEAQEARFWLMKKSPIAYCVMDFLASNMDRYKKYNITVKKQKPCNLLDTCIRGDHVCGSAFCEFVFFG